MLRIINKTNSVVVVYNDNFNCEVAIGETKTVSDDFLTDCSEIFFKYFYLKESETECGWEKGISRYYYLYNKKVNIPTITKASVRNIEEIVLERNDTNVNAIIIKTFCVKGILCKNGNEKIENQKVLFCDSRIRKRLLWIMIPKLTILLLFSVLLALTAVIAEGTTEIKIVITCISALLFLWWLYSIKVYIKIKHYENAQNKYK
ncbi:MAG: hypothetical protein IJ039_09690 [Clostridia bacterium]|nr:hypothetical protein [Clostridia bacterium]